MFRHIWPVLLAILSMATVQSSASFAKYLFPILGPAGMTAWRLVFSSIILSLIFKPWRKPISRHALKYILLYGLVLGVMNLTFYSAINRIPIGIAVAIELVGPISVAMFASRKLIDFLWLAIAVVGLVSLLPIHQANSDIDLLGVIFALAAGCCWAMYIIFGRKAGQLHGSSSVALGSIFITLFMFPIGIWQSGDMMFSLDIIPQAFLVALLASAIPYGLDMIAMPRLPAQTFSTLMSLSPVLGALSGFIFLSEQLTFWQWLAVMLIIISSIGTVFSFSGQSKVVDIEKTQA